LRKLSRAIAVLIACVSMLISGCGAHRCPVPPRLSVQGRPIVDVHVYVAPEFTERERVNIINGILMWERATSGLVVWHMLPYDPAHPPPPPRGKHDGIEERSVLFRRAVSEDPWVVKWDADHAPKKTLFGLCQGNSLKELTWLWLVENRLTTPEAETIIAAHEFGHAIGLDHVEHKDSVMSEFYNTATKCLSPDDLNEFCKKHGCNPALLTVACKPE